MGEVSEVVIDYGLENKDLGEGLGGQATKKTETPKMSPTGIAAIQGEGIQESQSEVKSPKDLKRMVEDKNINADQLLDVFEQDYIPSVESYKYNDYDSQILIFTDLPKRLISDPSFSEKVVDLPNANDKKLDNLPPIIRERLKLDDEGEWGHAQFRKFPEDQRWGRYWQLVEKYSEKVFDIVKSDPETLQHYKGQIDEERFQSFANEFVRNLASSYAILLNEVKEKSAGKDLVSSGEWLGSGTFLSNVEKMLEYGGKMKSAYHVLNSGQQREDVYGAIKGGDTHKAYIFFFHWRNEDYKHGADIAGHYGTLDEHNQPIPSDVGVFYPVDSIYRNGLSIGSYLGDKSTSEFFVTKSPNLVKEGRRLNPEEIAKFAREDQTELPLTQAFFRVDKPEAYQNIKSLFTKFGYEENWINDHLYLAGPGSKLEEFKNWLSSRPYTKAEIPAHKPTNYEGNTYLWESVTNTEAGKT